MAASAHGCEARKIGLLLCLLAVLQSGCGQTLSVKLERIKTVEDRDIGDRLLRADDARIYEARIALARLAESALEFFELIAPYSVNDLKTQVDADRKFFRTLPTELRDPAKGFSVTELTLLAAECKSRLAPLNYPIHDLRSLFVNDAPRLDRFEAARKRLDQGSRRAEQEVKAVSMYGGFHSNSVFLLNKGSGAYEDLQQAERNGKAGKQLVHEPLSIALSADSTVMVVQEDPTYFAPRYIHSDPTQAIKNALVILNRVLRIAAAYVPMISGVIDTTVAGPSGTQPANAGLQPVPVDVADEIMDESDERVRDLLTDSALVRVLQTLRENGGDLSTLNEADQATLRAAARVLAAHFGAGLD